MLSLSSAELYLLIGVCFRGAKGMMLNDKSSADASCGLKLLEFFHA